MSEKLFRVTRHDPGNRYYDGYLVDGKVYKVRGDIKNSTIIDISILSVVCDLQEQNKQMAINIAQLREQNNMLLSQMTEVLNILKYQPGTGSEYLKAKEDYEKNK